jgi:hypothetical protein
MGRHVRGDFGVGAAGRWLQLSSQQLSIERQQHDVLHSQNIVVQLPDPSVGFAQSHATDTDANTDAG